MATGMLAALAFHTACNRRPAEQIPPGTRFAQARGDGGIWFLESGKKRGIPDPQTCIILSCVGHVQLLSPELLNTVPPGPPVPPLSDGIFVQGAGSPGIYRIDNHQKHGIPDAPTCAGLGCIGHTVQLSPEMLASIPTGAPLPSANPPSR